MLLILQADENIQVIAPISIQTWHYIYSTRLLNAWKEDDKRGKTDKRKEKPN